ncbi:hypothetical protein HK102_003095, partial [Quaeritorhiza haematococci]
MFSIPAQRSCTRRLATTASLSSSSPSFGAKSRFIPKSGTYPLGFVAGGLPTGVKKKQDPTAATGPKDLTIVLSPHHPATASAVFTKNSFAAAPVQVSKAVLSSGGGSGVRGVVVNSGCANACTGKKGLADAWEMCRIMDRTVKGLTGPNLVEGKEVEEDDGERPTSTLVMSTGVIGQHLKMDKIDVGIRQLATYGLTSDHGGWMSAAEGIMTTDTFPKLRSGAYRLETPKATTLSGAPSPAATYRMAGLCKGAGMIHPNMATMLAAVFTDAKVSKPCLDAALR